MSPTPANFRYDAFLSYRRHEPDRSFARGLLSRLEQAGFSVAIDERDFRPEQTFLQEMERCIRESRFTLALLSPAYFESGNTLEESIFCKVLDLGERRRRLIPLILEPVERPVWLYDLVGIDFTDLQSLVDPYDRLLRALGTPSNGSSLTTVARTGSRFPDARTRSVAEALEKAYRTEEELVSFGGDPTAVRQEIPALRRELREGGRLQPTAVAMEPRFHVFLSHNSQDKSIVLELWEKLRERGLRPWLDDKELTPDKVWQRELEEVVSTIPVAAVLVSGNGMGRWEDSEMQACLQEFVQRQLPVIPVLLPGTSKNPALPIFLRLFTWVDLRGGLTPEGIDRLVHGITGKKPASPSESPGNADPQGVVATADTADKELADALADGRRRKRELMELGADTRTVEQEILDLRRTMREGGRLQPGDILSDRFSLIERLGQGGFATVWKAYDQDHDRLVALKVLHGQFGGDRTQFLRFNRGARKMAELHHQGIVRIIELPMDDGGFHFFVMEFEPGGDLRQAVIDRRLPRERVIPLLSEVAEVLDFAHERGVVHRDVKPANILLDAAGYPKLTDFDLVQAADTTAGTIPGAMIGTFLYAAPEAMTNPQEATVAADIYSLAMTAAFCLSGEELTPAVLLHRESFFCKIPCPPGAQEILAQGAAVQPEDRFASATDLIRALADGLAASAVEVAAPGVQLKARQGKEMPGPPTSENRFIPPTSELVPKDSEVQETKHREDRTWFSWPKIPLKLSRTMPLSFKLAWLLLIALVLTWILWVGRGTASRPIAPATLQNGATHVAELVPKCIPHITRWLKDPDKHPTEYAYAVKVLVPPNALVCVSAGLGREVENAVIVYDETGELYQSWGTAAPHNIATDEALQPGKTYYITSWHKKVADKGDGLPWWPSEQRMQPSKAGAKLQFFHPEGGDEPDGKIEVNLIGTVL
jgi:serine/threonine protein kinase